MTTFFEPCSASPAALMPITSSLGSFRRADSLFSLRHRVIEELCSGTADSTASKTFQRTSNACGDFLFAAKHVVVFRK
jgi:hypothetical protein